MSRDVATHPVLNRFDQELVVEGPFEEFDRAQLDGANRRRQIAAAGHQDDGKRPSARSQPRQRFETVRFRNLQVKNDTTRSTGIELFNERGSR